MKSLASCCHNVINTTIFWWSTHTVLRHRLVRSIKYPISTYFFFCLATVRQYLSSSCCWFELLLLLVTWQTASLIHWSYHPCLPPPLPPQQQLLLLLYSYSITYNIINNRQSRLLECTSSLSHLRHTEMCVCVCRSSSLRVLVCRSLTSASALSKTVTTPSIVTTLYYISHRYY